MPSVEGADLAEALDPLTAYLSENLGIDVEGVVASDYAATVEVLGTDHAQVIISDAGSLYNATERYDAEVSFAYWDARTTVTDEAPDVAEEVVAFAYTEMIPNGGVAVSSSLPADLIEQLTELLDGYADSSEEAATVMFDLVGLSDWTNETADDEINRYGEILAQFSN